MLPATAPSPAGSQQLPLLPPDASKGVLEGQAGANAGERKVGRPPGSANKFQKDLVRLVTHRLGRHPLEEVARLYMLSPEELRTEWPGCRPHEVKERLLHKLVDSTTQRPGVQINPGDGANVVVVLGDLAADAPGSNSEEDLTLDLPASDFNDLDDEAA